MGDPFPVPPAVLRGQSTSSSLAVVAVGVIPDDEVLEQDFLTVPGCQPVEPLVA